MIFALGLSIVFALFVGILAARNRRAESVILPLLDIFQSIPVLGFFPFVIAAVYGAFPDFVGANLAVIILIFTSMSWNIAFGVYEAVKAIPQDYFDLLNVSQAGPWERVRSLYIPASMSRIAYNTQISWAVGLFFLVASEIISLGTKNVPIQYGIGVAVESFAGPPFDFSNYALLVGGIIVAVIVWRFLFLREFALWSERFKMMEEPRETHRDPIMRAYSWINARGVSKLFLLTQGRGVDRFTSAISRFGKGLKYALAIFGGLLLMLILVAAASSGTLRLEALPSLGSIASTEATVLVALVYSFVRVWYVVAICVAVGLPMGIVISLNFKLYDSVSPLLEVISSIPAPILLPLIVLIPFVGTNPEAVAGIVIFLSIFWYIVFNVMAGVRTLPADMKDLPHAFKVGRVSSWRNVYIPSALSALVTGAITAVGGAWNALIIAEYFQPDPTKPALTQVGIGIGKMITVATDQGNLETLFLAVASMTILIVAFNLTVWRRLYHRVTKKYSYNR
ncbi:MAG: ABC transporter permease subunit [Nitrososphaerota archaeon]|jgi:NitT/TauT family transport system permease protein|nr:ABC transporter permease subunit [Nitrososphaerota archaeon]MDG6960488.1 ABC transporter permease subunit [Nitrososphaerota archaeon]MDG6961523.1 ABC transporter permease subunit [Nitrososphaerota archaeon]MDG7015201.1 ABC transporter permease subunit [Nitrososphaerota archaeon]WGO49961.1 MAG: ABC transporter permease subunit [Nitrososphaerota archaeon]